MAAIENSHVLLTNIMLKSIALVGRLMTKQQSKKADAFFGRRAHHDPFYNPDRFCVVTAAGV